MMCVDFYDLLISSGHIDLCVSLSWLNLKSELASWRNKVYLCKIQVLSSDTWKLRKRIIPSKTDIQFAAFTEQNYVRYILYYEIK